VFAKSVHVLVDNQLRPGADSSRADAELAAARNLLAQAEQNSETNLISLAEALGLTGVTLSLDSGSLVARPPQALLSVLSPESHPMAMAQAAAVSAAQARSRALERSYYPRFSYQVALYGRGSGALVDGSLEAHKGLFPDVSNWAVGLSVTFPALDIFGVRARRRAEASIEEAEKARYEQTLLALKAQEERANSFIKAAVRISENTPVQLKAAQETEQRARARYEAGLGNIVEAADAQRLLTQAEIDHEVARLNIWRAHLAAAKARGDIKLFLDSARNAYK
jgi:outer membrane protein